MRIKKIFNNKKNKQKSNINRVIEYLVDCYYLEPTEKISVSKIKKSLKLEDNELVDLFIGSLKEKKFLKGRKQFILTFDGLLYLEELERKDKEHLSNLISLLVSLSALVLSFFAIWNNPISKVMSIIYLFLIFSIINVIIEKK